MAESGSMLFDFRARKVRIHDLRAAVEPMNISRDRSIALLRRAQGYSLAACALSLPLQSVLIVPGIDLTLTKIAGAMLVLLVIIEYPLSLRWLLPRIGIESATVLALGAAALSLPASVLPKESITSLLIFAQYAVICYACAHVAMRRDAQTMLPRYLACGAAISGAGAVLAWFHVLVTPTVDALVPGSAIRRVCFGMPDANEQAMVFVFVLALLLFSTSHRAYLSIKIASILLIAAGLLLTMSRTGWVCAAIVIAMRCFAHERRKVIVPMSLGVVVVCAIGVALMKPDIADSIWRRIAEATSAGDRSIASRVLYNVQAIETAENAGAFGYGVGAVYHVTKDFADPLGRTVGVTVHNVPLTVWIEAGWVGLLAYLWLWSSVAAVLFVAWRRAHDPQEKLRMAGYCVVATSYAIFSQTMPFLQRSSLAILLGCALGAAAIAVNTSIKEDGVVEA
ncbi:MAG: O-antigen ligase family protein [Candidatus Hydrogenedentes bacterium]|nr:O-antigen ligase family protein [Candidatus Hydrogenedentota bacterium]